MSATITREQSSDPQVLWKGKVVLPQQPRDQYPVRLVIKEVEVFLTDSQDLADPPSTLPKEERIVYADVFQLSGPMEQ